MSAVDTTGPLQQRSSSLAPSKGLGARAARNTFATVVVVLAFVIAVIPLVWIIVTVLQKGAGLLPDASWWTNSQRGITPRIAGGGAYHAIIGTILQALATAVIAVPIGIFAAILLVEYSANRLARVVSFTVDILSGLPSIVAALFIYAFWITTLGFSRSGFAVSLALVLLMIPVIVRSTEEMLKLVPNELREASFALGVPKWKTIVRIVLPTAFSGIITGILLGLARIMGETAPLLILVGYSQSINTNLFSGNMAALPLMINNDRQQALAPAVERVWAAALTLVLIVLVLNIAGRLVARFSSVKK